MIIVGRLVLFISLPTSPFAITRRFKVSQVAQRQSIPGRSKMVASLRSRAAFETIEHQTPEDEHLETNSVYRCRPRNWELSFLAGSVSGCITKVICSLSNA